MEKGSAIPLARHQLGAVRAMQLVAAHIDMWTVGMGFRRGFEEGQLKGVWSPGANCGCRGGYHVDRDSIRCLMINLLFDKYQRPLACSSYS